VWKQIFCLIDRTVLLARTMFQIKEQKAVASPQYRRRNCWNNFFKQLGDNMKFKHGLVTAGCLVAMGLAGTAQAVQVAGELLEVYGNFYPQYQITSFADGATGTQQSTMTTGLNTPATPAVATTKPNVTQVNWVNSYLGFKGQKGFGDITAGYDFQGVVMSNGTLQTETNAVGAARDAFVFVAHKKFGTLQFGQMDTIYKEFGDRVRLLGTSSSNFTSTSSMVSGVTWKAPTANAAGTTSFNTRINGQVRWISPNWSGVEVGVSIRPDPARTATTDASLSAMGIRWSNPKYYVGLAQEVHNDYRTMSGTNAADVATNVFNVAPRSKDTATRLSFGYTAETYKLGADFSSLKYTEDATIATTPPAGKSAASTRLTRKSPWAPTTAKTRLVAAPCWA
jgi:predicted porin